ncbi:MULTISPECIES: rod shape-determining protein MreC [unclassified Tatumella]|uniref:rod shape-determining protein MreC n=1 Tax=unclassified Tatumella TaxID=2649542 RepID=UPI001BAFC0FA|nr:MULTISPECIES: rod shape-determining protein MreC [unclassified Tatumella]MBS0877314.1 rod shape-determining protein MreC [Tatumella sp. JGM82]MBS0890813.1 rod shape-determining protein MreC [Tatumella sp. JGM94]MBS0893400.1 rod shape-determining protein MreC [Tatumella sp. JGM130]MBS0901711.1 rod shape-determining protein MreC [Tatumella sp. JGM100]
MKPIFSRGPSLQLRLVLAVVAAIAIIIADSRMSSFREIRSYLDTSVSPFYFLADGPRRFLDGAAETFASRQMLEQQNTALRRELMLKNSQLLLLDQYKEENIRLRELLGSPLRPGERKMITQVISAGADPYSDQVIIDRGSDSGVYEGQPVISDKGVVGQVVSVGKFSSRVMLICDASHALPVQVLRNDVRAIASGTGCSESLQLENMSGTPDIRVGDMLVSSGLGGRFPEGYPVAVVSSVTVDTRQAATIIQARPTAGLQRLRYLLLLWGAGDTDSNSVTPEAVHQAADQRLMQMMPQVLPPAGEAGKTATSDYSAGTGSTSTTPSADTVRGERP